MVSKEQAKTVIIISGLILLIGYSIKSTVIQITALLLAMEMLNHIRYEHTIQEIEEMKTWKENKQ